jgi:hypothetical protein
MPLTTAQAAYRARAIAAGLCRTCCVLDTRPGKATCQRCHDARRTRRAALARAKRARTCGVAGCLTLVPSSPAS